MVFGGHAHMVYGLLHSASQLPLRAENAVLRGVVVQRGGRNNHGGTILVWLNEPYYAKLPQSVGAQGRTLAGVAGGLQLDQIVWAGRQMDFFFSVGLVSSTDSALVEQCMSRHAGSSLT